MKKKHMLILAAVMAATGAHADYKYANSMSVAKIATIQDSITRTAMHMFYRSPTAVSEQHQHIMAPTSSMENTPDLYGHAPMYGTAPMYGEYEAYEFAGRSGGETELVDIKNLQLGYSHYDTTVNFDNFARTNSDYDMIMFGITDGATNFMDTSAAWAVFAGAINGRQHNHYIDLDEVGGYAGLYGRLDINNFGLAATFNGGAIQSDAKHAFGTDDYTNMWTSAGVNATYNINLDNTFVLQPGIYLGYTWVKSGDYLSESGIQINNSDANIFQISPSMHAIKHIGDGWYGTAHVRYVKTKIEGAQISTGGKKFDALEFDDFVEYGLSLEKSIDRFGFSGTILRRDLGQDGWGGHLNIKYIF